MSKKNSSVEKNSSVAVVEAPRRGRPPVFTKGQRRKVSVYLRKFGLTHGVAEAAKGSLHDGNGVVMSVPTAIKIAAEYGITFQVGRPKVK